MTRRVSVHIVTYNSEAFISDCLRAVMQQTHPIDQIIVIDNQSTDGTLAALEPYRDRITVAANTVNNGFAGGHNQAIRLAGPMDYYLILNPDVTMHPDYVYHLVRRMTEEPKLGSSTGKLLFKQNPEVIDSTGLLMTRSRRAFDRGAGDPASQWASEDYVFGVSGAAAVYSGRMVQDISVNGEFFDEDFFAYKEDVDVAWRAQLLGWRAVYCPQAEAYHDRGWKKGARDAVPLRIRRFSYINRYKMIIKNDAPKRLLAHGRQLLLYEVGALGYFLLREPKVLGSWAQLLRVRRELMAKRRYIQRKSEGRSAAASLYGYFK